MVFLILFIAYLGISIYHNDPHWTTREMIRQPAGQAAVVLESLLMVLMFGQVRVSVTIDAPCQELRIACQCH
jgi:hypothetical protein